MRREARPSARSEDLQRTLEIVNRARFPAIVIDPEPRTVQQVNRPFTETFGWSTSDLAGRAYLSILHEGDRTTAKDMVSILAFGGTPGTVRLRMADPDDEMQTVMWTGIPNLLKDVLEPLVVVCRPCPGPIDARLDAPVALRDRKDLPDAPEATSASDAREGETTKRLW